MIIINADDWGRSINETNAALLCFNEARITTVSAMVFMEDSIRASDIARKLDIDVGLHRCGISYKNPEKIFRFIKFIISKSNIKCEGILTHAGQVY